MLDVTFLNKHYITRDLPKQRYWERHSNIFYWLRRFRVKQFKKTFPHDVFHGYCLDDEELICHLARAYGWRVTDEEILPNSSTYEFENIRS